MKDAVNHLMKEHGGKTVTISVGTIVAALWLGADLNLWEIPIPASRGYVQAQIAQSTKGLDYLVRKELEHDLDVLNYSTTCMHNASQAGAMRRLEEQYSEWFKERYSHKSCEQLESDPQIAAEAPR
jgi:hypothetical protein